MRSGNRNQQCEEYEEDDFNSSKDGPFSNTSNNITATSTKDKSNDKTNAMRSKHSVTEQRRRSKINERFQILRDLIPNTDQKRDTASFLLEVIDYVKYLHEKVEKYEGSYPGCPEPTKLMPWRNSHWRVPGFVGQPQHMKNASDSVPTISGNFEEGATSNVLGIQPNTLDLESGRDPANKSMRGQETEVSKQDVEQIMSGHEQSDGGAVAYPLQRLGPDPSQSMECPVTANNPNQHEDFTVEGGTINITSVYSQELLSTLTDALHSAGVDLSHANISMQINLGKRANRGPTTSTFMDNAANGSNQAQKRPKT